MSAAPIVDFRGPTEPRRRHQPSPRNIQIYEAVRVQGQVQAQVAARLGLSQRRVSQICQQVDRWRASLEVREPVEAQAVDRQVVRKQLDEVYVRALRQLERSQSLVERRAGERGGKSWSVQTVREQPGDAKWLRLALAAVQRLAELESGGQTERNGASHRFGAPLPDLPAASAEPLTVAGARYAERDGYRTAADAKLLITEAERLSMSDSSEASSRASEPVR